MLIAPGEAGVAIGRTLHHTSPLTAVAQREAETSASISRRTRSDRPPNDEPPASSSGTGGSTPVAMVEPTRLNANALRRSLAGECRLTVRIRADGV